MCPLTPSSFRSGARFAGAALVCALALAVSASAWAAAPEPGSETPAAPLPTVPGASPAPVPGNDAPVQPKQPLPPDLVQPVRPAKELAPEGKSAIDPAKHGLKLSPAEVLAERERCERASYIVRQANEFRDESPLAVGYYKRALDVCPGHPEANFRLGVIAYHQKNVDETLRLFGVALRSNPKLFEAHYNLGILNRQLRKPDAARLHFANALKIDPTDAPTLYNMGVLYLRQLDRPQALEYIRKALAADPKMAEPHFFYGALLQEEGKRAEAKKQLQTALGIKPNLALPRVYLAAILEAEGDSRAAQQELNQALRLNPASVNVGYGFEEFYFREGGANTFLTRIREPKKQPDKALMASASPVKGEPKSAPPISVGSFGNRREARELPAEGAPPAPKKQMPKPVAKAGPRKAGGGASPPAPPRANTMPERRTEKTRLYRVQPGDTLSRLALRYGTSMRVLARLNQDRIEHPSVLEVGQLIEVPRGAPRRILRKKKTPSRKPARRPARTSRSARNKKPTEKGRFYRVRPGDSLLRIARRHGTTLKVLLALNRDRIEHPSMIQVGDLIRLPDRRRRKR